MPNVIINNVDKSFFDRNKLSAMEVIRMLEALPVPTYVNRIVLDGDTTGKQTGTVPTNKHPMIYALNKEDRKVPVFMSSNGRATRNVGAKRILKAIVDNNSKSVVATPASPLPAGWEG